MVYKGGTFVDNERSFAYILFFVTFDTFYVLIVIFYVCIF
ncbi:hypothetical protein MGSAQ_000087 [marine sediment metagenome]|uniref:Uncharacterized protein n=1 Tax=marine sediment metagenome TaxID=412755 RepID=A0A1B6NYC0_9ZZZZ